MHVSPATLTMNGRAPLPAHFVICGDGEPLASNVARAVCAHDPLVRDVYVERIDDGGNLFRIVDVDTDDTVGTVQVGA